MVREQYLMRNLAQHKTGLSPGDYVQLLVRGTLSGSSVTVDLSGLVRDGAIVHYFAFKPATLDTSGQFTAAAAVAGASDAVIVMVLVDPKDYKWAGE